MINKNLILLYPPKVNKNNTESDISLALLYLAGAVRDSGVCDNIGIFDFNTPVGMGKNISDLIAYINSFPPGITVVGINCLYSALFPSVRKIAKSIKEQLPEAKVVTGGMHPTLFAREIIDNCIEIDAVSIGESESTFPQLLRYFYGEGELEIIECACLRVDGNTVIKPQNSYIENLDALSRPGYEFFDLSEYEVDTSKWWSPDNIKISNIQMPILTSRSCPNKCTFCSMRFVMGDKFRARSAESVFEEIKYLYHTFDVNYYKIMDDNLTLNRQRIISLCKMIIESGMKVYFGTPNGISLKTLDAEMVILMRRAGFIMVALAVESGSEYIRNQIMGKNMSRDQIINAFKLCRSVGINAAAFFMIGMPEDTEETLKETIDLLNDIDAARLIIHLAKPLPGTKLYEQCIRDNLLIEKLDADTQWTGEAEFNTLTKEDYFIKRLVDHSPRQVWIKPYNLSVERLTELDVELQQIAYKKTRSWVEHVRNL